MKRLAAIAFVLACAAVVAVLGTGASSSGEPYKVRAIFDSAFSVIQGEDVKVAGVKVGKISKLEVTPDNRAAIVLEIDKPGFGDFREDASCRIRPQSLIGEKFVECTPTQPRAPGEQPPPLLRTVPKGQPGAGQHLLPVGNTERTVDIDLINNIMRLPFRERFSILLSEFGAGLAGNGHALNQAIRRADPALRETDKVINLLASQNRTLAQLARDGDTVLAPLARRRQQVADFVVKAGDVAQATAERSPDLQRTFQRLPKFLRELRPTMVRLGAFSDQAAPVVEDLGAEAPSLTRFAKALGPFSKASIPAIRSLGSAAEVGKTAVPATLPITKEVRGLAGEAKPLSANLRATLESLRDTGGIERLLDYIFFQVAAINGFDSIGHYLRAGLIVNTCSSYATTFNPACSSKFSGASGTRDADAARVSATPTGDPYLDRMQRILARIAQGEDPEKAARAVLRGARTPVRHQREHRRHRAAKRSVPAASTGTIQMPPSVLPGAAPQSAPAPVPQAASSHAQPVDGAAGQLLDYLLGGDGGGGGP